MPKFLEATVIRPTSGDVCSADRAAMHDEMAAQLARWDLGQTWWGERGIEGPAAVLTIDSGTDMLAALFAITEMGYVITGVHLRFRPSSG